MGLVTGSKWMMVSKLIALVSIFVGLNAYAGDVPKTVSDEQAATEATENRQLANDLWQRNTQACMAADKVDLFTVMREASAQLDSQPTDHLKYRARFVYSGCQQMLLTVSYINGSCLNGPPSKYDIEYANRRWEKDSAQCNAEIAAPDLALAQTEEEVTEAKWEAERKKEGSTDEEIAVMKAIRNL